MAQRLFVADRLAERIDDQGYQHEDRQVREARYHHQQVAVDIVAHHLERVAERVGLVHLYAQVYPADCRFDAGREPLDHDRLGGLAHYRGGDVIGAYAALRDLDLQRVLRIAPSAREIRDEARCETYDQRREVDDVDQQ